MCYRNLNQQKRSPVQAANGGPLIEVKHHKLSPKVIARSSLVWHLFATYILRKSSCKTAAGIKACILGQVTFIWLQCTTVVFLVTVKIAVHVHVFYRCDQALIIVREIASK